MTDQTTRDMVVAPPQTPSAQREWRDAQRELQKGNVAQDVQLLGTAYNAERKLERIQTTVTIPPDYQYRIPIKGVKIPGTDQWDNSKAKVGLTIDGYEFINRIVGASFFLPRYVHNSEGEEQLNPIHRKDYIYLRMGAVWYSPTGQLLVSTEDIEVDFNLVWMDARINTKDAVPLLDERGQLMFDDFGNPALKLSAADEMKALKTLSQLRSFGLRYAQSVARVRLLKQATGIRSLPIDVTVPYPLMVTGYRDEMTAEERLARVKADTATFAGQQPADDGNGPSGAVLGKPLTAAEMAEVEPELAEDALDTAAEQVTREGTGDQQPAFDMDDVDRTEFPR